MIKYVDGTVFNQKADAIVNTVNTVGVMGAGLALEFALRYPEMASAYEEKCKSRSIAIGKLDYYKARDVLIINFPTKIHFKYPSKIEWIEAGLRQFVSTYRSEGVTSVAFPRLGTSNGGLNWDDVSALMEKFLSPLDIDVYICLDRKGAEGLEKNMVDKYNNTSFAYPIEGVRLTRKQIDVLENSKPINRFWQIKELDGIGITCYKRLFNYCKSETDTHAEQISFDEWFQ
ncbi:MAG: macro domain-containing protein [Clostridia bacterium]|nr:macro domain-containing protein [Clostridia bacterium]